MESIAAFSPTHDFHSTSTYSGRNRFCPRGAGMIVTVTIASMTLPRASGLSRSHAAPRSLSPSSGFTCLASAI